MHSPSPSTRCRLGLTLLALAAFAAPSCRPAGPELAPAFRLVQVRPKRERRVGVFLNEAITFHFSAPIDPASVTRESLIVRELGRMSPARGHFKIEGDHVVFLPELGSKRDLSDGGFRPGTTYELLLRGFPAPDGLRSTEGRILDRSHRLVIETAKLTEPRGQMFDDYTPEVGAQLTLESRKVPRGGPIVFRCPEPIDPSTLLDGEFQLERIDEAGKRIDEAGKRIPLRLLKLENSHRGGARIEFEPERLLAARESYRVPHDLVISARDFTHNTVWYPLLPNSGQPIEVYEESKRGADLIEGFKDTARLSPLAVPDVDGTAAWLGDGTVSVRFLAAAGDGRDGACALGATEGRKDLQATRLELEEGMETELLSVPGLVVLRAQGRMSIAGRLVRNCGTGPRPAFRDESLSSWLERAREEDTSWTVLIAGGDLVIDGEIDVEGPLLLAAGGQIRVTGSPGSVRAQESDLWLVGDGDGDGGGPGLDYSRQWVDLALDPPLMNPLVGSLEFAVLSGPLPWDGRVDRWLAAEVQLRHNRGSARVRFVVADVPLHAPLAEWGAVEEITDLPSTAALRLLIELRVDPPTPSGEGRAWNPPFVDEVRLFWDEVQPGGR